MKPTYSLGQSLLKIDNVCLQYNGVPVLSNVCAEIRELEVPGKVTGQIVGFLGPSGIGKTQLFRIIAGLNTPTSGQVSIMGANAPVKSGQVGVVAQSYPLFDHRTVLSNLMIAAQQLEPNEKVAKAKAIEYMNEFDLIDSAHSFPSQLSGGQKQRAAILQQVLCGEHFLLMDEPFSGLDMLMLEKTCRLISKIASLDKLNTVVVVTHDIPAAASVADHLWLMGRDLGEDGKRIPGSRIVKEFNLIDRNLCWHDEISRTPEFSAFVREVKEEFKNL